MVKVIHILPSNAIGGAPMNVSRIVGLTEDAFDHKVFFIKFYKTKNVKISSKFIGKVSDITLLNILYIFIYLMHTKITGKKFVVLTHGRMIGLVFRPLCKLLSIPNIHTYRGFTTSRYSGLFAKLINGLYILIEQRICNYGKVVAVSESEKKALIYQLKCKDVRVIYNPVQIEIEPKEDKDFDIVFLGRRSLQKGFDRFIEMFSDCTHLKVAWFGDGDMPVQLNLSANIVVRPAVKNVSEVLSNTKLLGVLSRWEGASTVVLEALQYGVPVISVECQGVDEFVHYTKGGTITSEYNFVKTINSTLEDDEKYHNLKRNTFKIKTLLDPSVIKKKYIQIIEECL